jgi:cytoskeletal protein CcmA (bactofilin family)
MYLKKEIKEKRIEGDFIYEGDVEFKKDCEIQGNLIVKGEITKGKSLKVYGSFSAYAVRLKGDLEALKINTSWLRAKNIVAWEELDGGSIESSGSIFAGIRADVLDEHNQIFLKREPSIIKGWLIFAKGDIISFGDIFVEGKISSGGSIIAAHHIHSTGLVKAKRNIITGEDIFAEWGIEAGDTIMCGGKLLAGSLFGRKAKRILVGLNLKPGVKSHLYVEGCKIVELNNL